MRILSQREILKIWKSLDVDEYIKNAQVDIRLGIPGEKIETYIDDVLETTNVVKDDQVVVRGVSGEEYVIDLEKFESRYEGPEITDEYQVYDAIGEVFAAQYNGDDVLFEAPWGESMILEPGDYLAHGSTEEVSGNIYRIEKDVFDKTYELIDEEE